MATISRRNKMFIHIMKTGDSILSITQTNIQINHRGRQTGPSRKANKLARQTGQDR